MLRRVHSALLSDGDIEFVSDGADGAPLAYIRSSADEKILVIINPADKEAVLEVPGIWNESLYTVGGTVKAENGKRIISPKSANVLR